MQPMHGGMTRGDGAGASAEEHAAQLREQARRLEERAERFEQGAVGERRTASVLAALDLTRFAVFHDLGVPGSRANIDHVVVGPTGLFVIDTKNYTSRVTVSKNTLWCGRYPQTKRLDTAAGKRSV